MASPATVRPIASKPVERESNRARRDRVSRREGCEGTTKRDQEEGTARLSVYLERFQTADDPRDHAEYLQHGMRVMSMQRETREAVRVPKADRGWQRTPPSEQFVTDVAAGGLG